MEFQHQPAMFFHSWEHSYGIPAPAGYVFPVLVSFVEPWQPLVFALPARFRNAVGCMKRFRKTRLQHVYACLGAAVLFALMGVACSRDESHKSKAGANDVQVKLVTAYFSTPIQGKDAIDGFWLADQKDFAAMVEAKFMAHHKPQKGDLSIPEIQQNIHDARYFLRIDGSQCDELFLVLGGQAIAKPGEKRLNTEKENAYRVIFTSIDAKDKSVLNTAAEFQYFPEKEYIVLDLGGKPMKLYREKSSVADLVATYAKPALSTKLPQY